MRSLTNAISVMKNASNCQDCVTVAGVVELRQGGPRRPRLFGGRPDTRPATIAGGKPGCSPERYPAHAWLGRHGSARPCTHGRLARHCAARIL